MVLEKTLAAAAAKSLQACPTLCDPIDGSPPGLESPLNSKEFKPVNPKGNQPEYSLEGLMLELKLQYFGHLMQRANPL